jgi:hypothetical protein
VETTSKKVESITTEMIDRQQQQQQQQQQTTINQHPMLTMAMVLHSNTRTTNNKNNKTRIGDFEVSSFSCWWSPLRLGSGDHQQEKLEISTENYFEDPEYLQNLSLGDIGFTR